jgi:transposase-like protein
VKNSAKKISPREEKNQLTLQLAAVIRQDLHAFVVESGVAALRAMLEQERTRVCGERYAHQSQRRAYRNGHTSGELAMGGRRVGIKRPRARGVDGREVVLPSWAAFADNDPLNERALEQMLVGVSTRRYERSMETVGEVSTRGASKSAVSRRFVETTREQMQAWLSRDISPIDLTTLMIDGVHIAEHVVVVALGIDVMGVKHVLSLREGSTENSATVTALLSDLQMRGMRTEQRILASIDGSKALAKGIKDIFGDNVEIQRCQVHKVRNVADQLPKTRRPAVEMAMWQAYKCRNVVTARRALERLATALDKSSPGAAASLREGLEETLTVMRFGLPKELERTLSTTNVIENLIGTVRKTSARVQRWRDGEMILRWATVAVMDAEQRFLRVPKYGAMKRLSDLLRNVSKIDVSVNVA